MHDSASAEQQRLILVANSRVTKLEAILAAAAAADETGNEELKQFNAELLFRLKAYDESSVVAKTAYELRIAEFLASAETFENEAKTAKFKAQLLLEAS
eukprot:11855851-Heterocapsa_arctica.AAC.1